MDRSDSDECDADDDSGDVTSMSYTSGWGNEPSPVNTHFGWGSTAPDPKWEAPAERGLKSVLFVWFLILFSFGRVISIIGGFDERF